MTQVPPMIVTKPYMRLDKTNVNVDTVWNHSEPFNYCYAVCYHSRYYNMYVDSSHIHKY